MRILAPAGKGLVRAPEPDLGQIVIVIVSAPTRTSTWTLCKVRISAVENSAGVPTGVQALAGVQAPKSDSWCASTEATAGVLALRSDSWCASTEKRQLVCKH
jgi:hypothetical protein